MLPQWVRRPLLAIEGSLYRLTVLTLHPLNVLLARLLARRVVAGSVLHMSGMVHVAFHTVRILREHGINADYLAWGDSPLWDQADYRYRLSRQGPLTALREMWWVWAVVSRYEIIHSHFMVAISRSGWEWPLLRRMGRHIVVHFRGCEIRDRAKNQRLHPDVNICEHCDYEPPICEQHEERRRVALMHGSSFLVTTPDLKDFVPNATHVPFFNNAEQVASGRGRTARRGTKIVHATNHPGIEGTREIRRVIQSLRARGYELEFVELQGVPHDQVTAAVADADLTIGKMKMGYYANFQVESLNAGVPAITWVRDDLRTPELESSGLILTTLAELEGTLERLLKHPEELETCRRLARQSAQRLHDNAAIADQLKAIYSTLTVRP